MWRLLPPGARASVQLNKSATQPMLESMETAKFRLEFIEGPTNRVVHSYEVEAADAVEALSMACNDFNRVKAIYKASDFRVFDPRTQAYHSSSHGSVKDA